MEEKRYGGNKESKKVQRTLLKQQYENFVGSSSEIMDQTFDRLQKLISQLEIQGEVIAQEDMNLKLLRSLPSEWKTHALIWRNKEEIETISLDDLYNNLKIYEPELTRSSSTSQNPQNVAFVSSNSTDNNNNSNTNEADNTTYGVSAAHAQSNPTSGDNLSDAIICALLASQPNSPQLAREDLEKIDHDDLEEMDLQWEMAMLTIRARRFIKRTGRKLDVNGQRVRFNGSKVECYNCHKNGHFARECRAPRNQENIGRENSRRTVTVETPTKNALVAQDGIGGSDSEVKDTTARDRAIVSENKGKGVNAVKASACWGNSQQKEYKEKGVIDSGCSRHMTKNKCYLTEYEDYDGGFVSFRDGKEENAEFHQIVDFLSTCSINYALTAVVISESSVRSDHLFNDEDGIACLTNDEIFENLALMGYEQLSTKLTFQKGKVTLLFDSMLVQNQAPEGKGSTIPPEPQPTPSTSQPNVSEPQTESLQTETPPTVSHELQTEAHTEQILLSPSTNQRKQRKTQKHKRAKQVTELPQTSVLLDHGADKVAVPGAKKPWGGALAQTRSERVLEKPNESPLPEGHTSGSGEGNMKHTFELMNTVLPTPYDSPLIGGYTPGSDEGRLKLKELMAICTKLSKQVLDLDKEKDAQAVEILKLKQRVKKLERKRKSSVSHPRRRIYRQVDDFDVLDDDMEDVEGETIHTTTTGVSAVSAPVTTAGVAISIVEPRTPPKTAATAFIDEDLTIAQTLIKMKEEKSKEKGVAIKDVEDSPRPIRSITTLQPLPTINPKDKGKGVLVEEEPEKLEKLAELDRAQKEIQKQEEATNAALAEEFDEIQAIIDVDHELAVSLTHEEQEKYTIKEISRLLAEFFKRRKKQLAAERVEAIRSKPPTRTQFRSYMKERRSGLMTYSQQQAEITKKRPRADSKEENSKKQKLEDDNDAEKRSSEIVWM
ncbi:ribonuclease H-like domain-containing protein [Tanacetum coccineum]